MDIHTKVKHVKIRIKDGAEVPHLHQKRIGIQNIYVDFKKNSETNIIYNIKCTELCDTPHVISENLRLPSFSVHTDL